MNLQIANNGNFSTEVAIRHDLKATGGLVATAAAAEEDSDVIDWWQVEDDDDSRSVTPVYNNTVGRHPIFSLCQNFGTYPSIAIIHGT